MPAFTWKCIIIIIIPSTLLGDLLHSTFECFSIGSERLPSKRADKVRMQTYVKCIHRQTQRLSLTATVAASLFKRMQQMRNSNNIVWSRIECDGYELFNGTLNVCFLLCQNERRDSSYMLHIHIYILCLYPAASSVHIYIRTKCNK